MITGADAFLAFVSTELADVVTAHHGNTPEIVVTSPTTASGIWAVADRLWFPGGLEVNGFGHYHETYQKTDGMWRIKTSKLTRLRMDMTQPAAS